MNFKNILFVVIAVFIKLHSVSAQNYYSVQGTVIDSISKVPLEFITVTVTKNSVVLKSSFTDVNGVFKIEKLVKDEYNLNISGIGFGAKVVPIDFNSNSELSVSLGKIILNPQSKSLKEVIISGSRPLLKQEIDRVIYDVGNDPDSKSVSIFEIFRNVPLISIDAEDKIQVKGKSNFKILINGRPANILSRNQEEVLQSMPASNILRIEVITTPPARYDSEGIAGIINIIMAKKIDDGYNGSAGLSHNSLRSTILNNIMNIKLGKMGLSSNIGNAWRKFPGSNVSIHRNNLYPIESQITQEENSYSMNGNYRYSFSDISYEIDSLNLIAGTFGFERSRGRRNGDQTSEHFTEAGNLTNLYRVDNQEHTGRNGVDVGLNHQLSFRRNKEDLMTASYLYNDINYALENRNYFTEKINYPETDLKQNNKSGGKEQTAQLDYVRRIINKVTLEGGAKVISRDNYSDFVQESFNPQTGNFVQVIDRTRKFDYIQNVYSVYNSWNLKMAHWGIKAGIRLERTVIDANFISNGTYLKRGFNNLFPSISIQRTFNGLRSINASYSQRIQRPGIWELNPFENQSNPLYYTSGNPDLDPVINHNFEANYATTKTGFLNLGIDYSFSNTSIQSIILIGADNISRSTYFNIGKNYAIGASMNFSYPITKKLNVRTGTSIRFTEINGLINNETVTNGGVIFQTNNSLSYVFKNDWRTSMTVGSYSNNIALQSKTNGILFSSIAINKPVLQKKGTIYASVSNPFVKYRQNETQTSSYNFNQASSTQTLYQGFGLSFTYRFGRLKEQMKKNKRKVENNDVSKENIKIN